MFKIIYVSPEKKFECNSLSSDISLLSNHEINFICENDLNSAANHFFITEPVILLLIEEEVPGIEDFVAELKKDESFKYLPIIMILKNNSVEQRKKYYSLGVEGFLSSTFDNDELALKCSAAINNKIRLDQVLKQLGDVSEKNITKAIQLDLIRKFIPMTVWKKTESLAEGQSLEIPEEEQELAIIFADLQSFTTMAEKTSPKEVIQFLNGIFDITTRIVYQNSGDIDKFIGDAFLAVFDSPEMAVLSAIMIQEELEIYNKKRSNAGLPVTTFRMGIHFGKVIRGSVGGTFRYDNTLIGDPINTAQRLESMSPPGGLLASKQVIQQLKLFSISDIEFKSYVLKGKNKNIEACLLYDYYKTHKEFKEILSGSKKVIEV
jgi:adenylate cyclase